MSGQTSMAERVAARCGRSVDDVDQVFLTYGIGRPNVRATPRSIKLVRLRVVGDRTGNVEPGPIDRTFELESGVTVISGPNFRGKSSLLELIALLVSGRSSGLQADVRLWLTTVSLDLLVNEQPVGMRIAFAQGSPDFERGAIFSGTTTVLASADTTTPDSADVTLLASVDSDEAWEAAVASFMLSRLALEEVLIFTGPIRDDPGRINRHGWPAYFGTIYPPAGANEILLGYTASGGLAIRLLQVFLDLPAAALRTRVHATAQSIEAEHAAQQRQRDNAARGLAARREQAEQALTEAEAALQANQAAAPAENLDALAALAATRSARYAQLLAAFEEANAALERAVKERIADERALVSLQESLAAGALFRSLNPVACPRCETMIDDMRREREQQEHECAVCAEPLPQPDIQSENELKQQAEEAVGASKRAVAALNTVVDDARRDLEAARIDVQDADTRLRAADAARSAADRIAAELAVATARGVLSALQGDSTAPPEPAALAVLKAAEVELDADLRQASAAIYGDLSAEVTQLAIDFGIAEINKIIVKGNATMDIYKGGADKSPFRAQSPGERFRLRYALLVALLRVAQKHKIAGHPGLLLLDSIKAEEAQDEDARHLLKGLIEIVGDIPSLQVIATTADDQLAGEVAGVSATITPLPPNTVLF